jgi:hypothetical protein
MESDKSKKGKSSRDNREGKKRDKNDDMDWEDNAEGLGRLLYPGEGETEEGDLDLDLDEKGLLGEEGDDNSSEEEGGEDTDGDGKKREREANDAQSFLLQRKAEAEKDLNSYLDRLDFNRLEYEAVRRFNLDSLKTVRADGLDQLQRSTGSFVNTMDGRLMKTGVSTSLADKKTTTFSFHPATLECVGCNINHSGRIWRQRGQTDAQEPTAVAILLTDQSYPPVLPTPGDKS